MKTLVITGLVSLSCTLSLFAASPADNTPLTSEEYTPITHDGAWCWFSDPRAIYVDDLIIGGHVDKEGSIMAFSYNPVTGERKETKLFDKLDYDDHANPAFMVLPDKRVVSFFSAHGGTKNSPTYYTITKKPADISEWEEVQKIKTEIPGSRGVCYSNPAQLADENNRTYLLFRGANFKPNFVYSDDLKTWSTGTTLVVDNPGGNVRPYLKMANNGKDKMFLAFTDGHPRNEPLNSIYFMMYRGGKLLKADGTVIGTMEEGQIKPSQCDKVYDASKTYEKAWVWDVAFDAEEKPVIVYARFSSVTPEHSYWYARWDGKKWNNHKITKAGIYFQRNDYAKEKPEYECNYSGGVYLDHENPDIVYTSRPINDIFEIEKWETGNKGKTWTSTAVTSDSQRDNVRPFVVRNHKKDQPAVLWMYNYSYPGFRAYDSAIRINQPAKPFSCAINKKDISSVADKVASWQIAAFPTQKSSRSTGSWLNGALYVGMFDWAETSGNPDYDKWLSRILGSRIWQMGNYMYHADDICVGQTCLDMYSKHKKDHMMIPTQARADWVIANRCTDPAKMTYGSSPHYERWSWCDALFMAPPVYARLYKITGDDKYMQFAHSEYKETYNKLFDKEENLFYRDPSYFDRREANGKKVFWGRGNGWVVGGLVEILKQLPKDDKTYRPYYENLFVTLCERLIGLQKPDGFWSASLLDADSYPAPETSGTGFNTYAFIYGINEGLLPRDKYLPAVEKGWKALVSTVNTEGKLCWVQPVGASPKKVSKTSTEVYGVGAFLMTAAELHRFAEQ